MTYSAALEYLMGIPRFSKSLSLDRIRFLLSAFGNPQNSLKIVHIAGTNGKGSTTTMLSHIFMHAGYKTGTYMSPFVEDFRERICVNGNFIEEDALCEITAKLVEIVNTMDDYPNAFEQITAMALTYFSRCGCDIVCLETGLGGRWDATNVIAPPLVSVITSIGLDHTQFLGDTLEKIALEKCGIIKNGSNAVISPLQPAGIIDLILADCNKKTVPARVGNFDELEITSMNYSGSVFSYKGVQYNISLQGKHQIANAITAFETAQLVMDCGYNISEENIYEGVKSATLPARMEIVSKIPLCIVDGAHNSPGINALCSAADELLGGKHLIVLFGCLQDKNAESMIAAIASRASSFICVMPDSPKACSADEIAEIAREYCGDVRTCPALSDAANTALTLAEDNAVILVCGSLYLAGPMKKELKKALNIK